MALRARLLYDFEGDVSSGELNVTEGEVLMVVRQDVGDGWWEGETSNGTRGLFPESYVEVLDDARAMSGVHSAPPPSYNASPLIRVDGGGVDDNWDDDWREDSWEDSQQSSSGTMRDENTLSPARASTSLGRMGTIRKNINRFSSFVKSGGESFILGAVSSKKVKIANTDIVEIVETVDGPQWSPSSNPFDCTVEQPKKMSKFKGMKSYIAYQVTNSGTNTAVLRRYKHFDWLHERLMEKFTLMSIPPLPDKQYAGRYGEEFVEKRREKLQMWLNRVARHPVVSQCHVLHHFLTCGENEKDWKAGKRRAEKDDLVGAAFFFTIQHPPGLVIEMSDQQVEQFGKFSRQMDEAVMSLRDKMTNHCEKCSGPFKREYEKIGMVIGNLGNCFVEDTGNYALGLTTAVKHTGQAYFAIGQLYEEQPKYDLIPLIDGTKEYLGLLSTFPDLVQVHKGAVEKVKEGRKLLEEGKMTDSELTEVTARTDSLSSVILAEIHHFQRERVIDFKQFMVSFLQEQISFHEKVIDKLKDSLAMYSEA
ncbi:sorting nexin-33-like [Corticium candelabrum]|uniref:sorting nexin-33-like n=1 Tax=Corticium candelabrum TaxID=121492 RepID=UPI002E272787|nr:sorting nexin-33-like [Corticium candelabrum]